MESLKIACVAVGMDSIRAEIIEDAVLESERVVDQSELAKLIENATTEHASEVVSASLFQKFSDIRGHVSFSF